MQTSLPAGRRGATSPQSATDDADYWRRRSEEALEVAYELKNAAAISKMLEIGRRYERLARQAEARGHGAE